MAVIANSNPTISNVVKQELWPDAGYCRAVVVVNDSAQTLVPGTVLGKVTATGKYKKAVQTASDGSQVADAIVIEEKAIAATTDTKVLVMLKGPAIVGQGGLVLDATFDLQAEKDAVYAALEAKGIACIPSV